MLRPNVQKQQQLMNGIQPKIVHFTTDEDDEPRTGFAGQIATCFHSTFSRLTTKIAGVYRVCL
jgi:hypothetical protein